MPASLERTADSAGPARGLARRAASARRRAGLRLLAGAPLERVRRIFLALGLVTCLVAVAAVAQVPHRTGELRVAGLVAIGALAVIWVRSWRREALSAVDEPAELGALFAIGLAAGPGAGLGLVYAGLYRRSLYGSPARAAAGCAVYALAYVLVAADRGGPTVVDALAQVPPLAIGCAVVQAFAALLVRHEQSLARERVLRDASAALVAARDRRTLYGATLDAVERLAAGGAVAAVVAVRRSDGLLAVRAARGGWLPGIASAAMAPAELPRGVVDALDGGAACAIDSPRLAGLELFAPPEVAAMRGVAVPLSARGRLLGVVAAFGAGVDAPHHVDALATLAAEAALALAGIDLADDAADDRSIRRLTERVRGTI